MAPSTSSKRNTGAAAPGDVFWVADYGQEFLIVIVQAVPKKSDAMVVYVLSWAGGFPASVPDLAPADRVIVSVVWKACRSGGDWTKVGRISHFDAGDWPIPNFRRRVGMDGWAVVVPHDEVPGHTRDEWNADAAEVADLFDYGISDAVALLRRAKRALDPTVEFPRGSSEPL